MAFVRWQGLITLGGWFESATTNAVETQVVHICYSFIVMKSKLISIAYRHDTITGPLVH